MGFSHLFTYISYPAAAAVVWGVTFFPDCISLYVVYTHEIYNASSENVRALLVLLGGRLDGTRDYSYGAVPYFSCLGGYYTDCCCCRTVFAINSVWCFFFQEKNRIVTKRGQVCFASESRQGDVTFLSLSLSYFINESSMYFHLRLD